MASVSESKPSRDSAPVLPEAQVETIVRRSRRSQRRYRRSVRVRSLQIALGATVFLVFLVLLSTWVYIGGLQNSNAQMAGALNQRERTIASLRAEIQRVRAERDQLVRGRIPDLHTMVFDHAIVLKTKYVRNVIFNVTGDAKQHLYEYRMLMSNNSLNVIHPDVQVLLFDSRGIQIGKSVVEKIDSTSNTDRIGLDPGETRAYSASIKVTGKEAPAYFWLRIR